MSFMRASPEGPNPLELTRSPLPAVSWSSFFVAVQEALALKLASAPPPGQHAPILVRTFPKTNEGKFDTAFDLILFRIVSSERAGTARDGVGRKPKGPTLKESIPSPHKARYHLITMGWDENVLVEFKILAKSNDQADLIVEWFHRFIIEYHNYLGFFKARGIQLLVYEKRGEDKLNKDYNQELYERTLYYTIRLELLNTFERKDIESLNISIQGNPDFEFTRTEELKVLT